LFKIELIDEGRELKIYARFKLCPDHSTVLQKELTASVESRGFKEQYQVDDLLLVAIAIERAIVRLAKHEGLRKWRFDLKRVMS
jgi:hypothetical protein